MHQRLKMAKQPPSTTAQFHPPNQSRPSPLLPLCRSLGGIAKSAALQHLLRDVKLGWEFTPAAAAASAFASTPPPTTAATTITSSHDHKLVSNGPSEGRHEGRQTSEEEEEEEDEVVVAKRKPTLLLLHGFMGSKVGPQA